MLRVKAASYVLVSELIYSIYSVNISNERDVIYQPWSTHSPCEFVTKRQLSVLKWETYTVELKL